MRNPAGAWIGVGAGVGVAMGTALHSVALGLAIGIAIGAALAFGLDQASGRTKARDHASLLREAIAEARAAGFGPAADELESACFGTAFTTSSDLFQEHRRAIGRFLDVTGAALPDGIRTKLKDCLAEIKRRR